MTEEEMKDLAARLVHGQAVDFDFQFLTDDEKDEIEGMEKEELRRLYDLITSSTVTLSWPEEGK